MGRLMTSGPDLLPDRPSAPASAAGPWPGARPSLSCWVSLLDRLAWGHEKDLVRALAVLGRPHHGPARRLVDAAGPARVVLRHPPLRRVPAGAGHRPQHPRRPAPAAGRRGPAGEGAVPVRAGA